MIGSLDLKSLVFQKCYTEGPSERQKVEAKIGSSPSAVLPKRCKRREQGQKRISAVWEEMIVFCVFLIVFVVEMLVYKILWRISINIYMTCDVWEQQRFVRVWPKKSHHQKTGHCEKKGCEVTNSFICRNSKRWTSRNVGSVVVDRDPFMKSCLFFGFGRSGTAYLKRVWALFPL